MPEYREFHEDAVISQFTLGYQPDENYIADLVLPIVPVTVRGGKYIVYGGEQFEVSESRHAPGALAIRETWSYSKDNFWCEYYLREAPVADETEREARESGLNLVQDAVDLITRKHLREKEARVAGFIIAGLTGGDADFAFGHGEGLGPPWSDHVDATPVDDAKFAKATMRAAGGMTPNALVISQEVFDELQMCEQIIDALPLSSERFRATPEQVARALMIDRLIIGSAQYQTADEGEALALGPIWGDDVIWAYINPAAGRGGRTLAKQFQYEGRRGTQYRDDPRYSQIVGIRECVGEKIVAIDCGVLGTGAIDITGYDYS